ncbi:MAG: helix-turn-helix transcriptional regulator [Rudaea sp.]|uniref:ArsR/SmtB family transcription factor n=1 Tax=unclassified Rudaea TaxID=2627037 RepID=UPI0010F7C1D9|nr:MULTISPECIES: helix-turn-helix domain-containing protein [unclassified Rudaea]MBN8886311.1 helix-turn-helix transcriptional regulator [Rudaea sp.]MBR0345913.1 helix-turn-helix transcriptional regulator [Rudaea sp.]
MKEDTILAALGALAQRSRLAIFRYLVEMGHEGAVAGQIAEALGIASTALTFHAKELVIAGLVRSEQQGRYVRYTANFEAMNGLVAYLTENCCRGDLAACCPPKRSSKPARKKT